MKAIKSGRYTLRGTYGVVRVAGRRDRAVRNRARATEIATIWPRSMYAGAKRIDRLRPVTSVVVELGRT
jgi:hypothetical protein